MSHTTCTGSPALSERAVLLLDWLREGTEPDSQTLPTYVAPHTWEHWSQEIELLEAARCLRRVRRDDRGPHRAYLITEEGWKPSAVLKRERVG